MTKNQKTMVIGAALIISMMVLAGCGKNKSNDAGGENAGGAQGEMKGQGFGGGQGRQGQGNGQGPREGGPGGPQISEEEQMAIDNKDYNAWLEAVPENSPMREIITDEEKFLKYVEMEEAMRNGDMEKVKKIREELGFPEMPEKQ